MSQEPPTAAGRAEGCSIDPVAEPDLEDLLPLVQAYCDFYEVSPPRADLLALCRALLADPELEGFQLIARERDGEAVGFATVFWSWDTTVASRIGILNDLYVAPGARGGGLARALIGTCLQRCRARGAERLEWVTGRENGRARALYDSIGAVEEPWVSYSLPAGRKPDGRGSHVRRG
jgi:GNAT superfamily N-acetyltransferase